MSMPVCLCACVCVCVCDIGVFVQHHFCKHFMCIINGDSNLCVVG